MRLMSHCPTIGCFAFFAFQQRGQFGDGVDRRLFRIDQQHEAELIKCCDRLDVAVAVEQADSCRETGCRPASAGGELQRVAIGL